MKRLLYTVLLSLIPIYLLSAFVYAQSREGRAVCQGVEIHIVGEARNQFITEAQVLQQLKKGGVKLTDQPLHEIDTEQLEELLLENRLIARAECYTTTTNTVAIKVFQRTPILRVMGNHGGFYIDKGGNYMPLSTSTATYLPLATGTISREFALEQLYPIALFLQESEFWNAQIEQIFVDQQGEIELVPRIGNQRILLGAPTGFETKLDHLKLFYEEVMPRVGWNKYATINLKYKRQIVCTPR